MPAPPRSWSLAVLALALAWSASGCLQTGVVQCSSGTICVGGLVCGDTGGCIDPEFCRGLDPGTSCTAPGVARGGCVDDVCVATVCGDGRVDATEDCDDAGVLDHDGCSSACRSEQPRWTELPSSATVPAPRSSAMMAYDADRDRVVLFGGFRGTSQPEFDDTWEWDGAAWTDVTPAGTRPPRRYGATMAYDRTRRRVVLVGGYGGGELADTWEWDGGSWTEVAAQGAGPSVRSGAAMAYDAARQRVVLFGGLDPTTWLADTWLWDGTTWSLATPAGATPPARTGASMTYDSARARIVLFGGDKQGRFDDTWEWDGVAWRQVEPSGPPPPARLGAGMVFDDARGRSVLFGGFGGVSALNDTWEWDGASWVQLASQASSPQGRPSPAMAYESAGRRLIMFGGSQLGVPLGDHWQLQHRAD